MTDPDCLDHVDDLSLPIALRRARRTGTGFGTVRRTSTAAINKSNKNPPLSVACTALTAREVSPPTPPTTPLRRNWKKNKKTARGIGSSKRQQHLSSGLEDELSLSTGLTPMVRRTSLQPQSPGPAAVNQFCSSRQQKLVSSFSERISKSNSRSNNINSIRRNVSLTMTEKMNRVYNERRKREKEAQEEIERLRAELKEKNERIEGLTKKEEVALVDGKGKGREISVAVQHQPLLQQQQTRSPETPSNSNRSTFHTALSIQRRSDSEQDLGSGGQGSSGQGQQQQHNGLGMPLQNNNDGPSSGSDTEALSFTTSRFGEAIRAQLDCSTPPSSGRSRPAARHYHHRPNPLPTPGPTTAAMATALGTHGELPITPCSNSRHDLDSRRTSNASTIRLQNSINDDTPTRSRTTGSVAPVTYHQHQHQLQHRTTSSRPSPSSYSPKQPQQQQQRNQPTEIPPSTSISSSSSPPTPDLQTLLQTNTSLQSTLTHTQASLRIALQTVTKFQLETEKLQNDMLLLKQEKRELFSVITDVQACLRTAVHKRDELWKKRMGRLREGLVEGVREGVEGGGEGRSGEGGLGKRKRNRQEEEEEEEAGTDGEEGDGNESCDLGSEHWRSAAGGGSSRESYDDGLEDMERRIMKMRARMMRKRRKGITGYVTAEVDSDPDA
ncbi:hypothetical protein B0T20DRAFT_483398 [Sordaria brevicollis]|uniref:Uncharacterized protein n=1 Tax=Sordaria brevicollis TaxID=83679 RepID=A0AAE0U5P9_SORBR|nr:hypothetical protein B0T20DRAFT_483398 [Sordaria brevicollis]